MSAIRSCSLENAQVFLYQKVSSPCPRCRTCLRQRTAIRRPVSAIRSWPVEMPRFWYQKLSSPCTRCQTYCSHSWPHPCRVDPADCWHSYGFAHALGRWQFGTQFAGNSMQFGCIFGNSADLGAPGRCKTHGFSGISGQFGTRELHYYNIREVQARREVVRKTLG